MQDKTTDIEGYERFVQHVREQGRVWGLKSNDGWVIVESSEEEDAEVMLFWSDEADARRMCLDEWADFVPTAIELDPFIDDWLQGMHRDGVLAGINWDEELAGIEVAAVDLAKDLVGGAKS